MPVDVVIDIDDIANADWHSAVDPNASTAVLRDETVRVIHLEGCLASHSASANIDELSAEAFSLHGRSPFAASPPGVD